MQYKCPKCGNLVEEGVNPCPTCGQQFNWPTKEPEPPVVEEPIIEATQDDIIVDEEIEETPVPKKSKKKLIIILLILLVVLAAISTLIVASTFSHTHYSNNKSSSTYSANSKTTTATKASKSTKEEDKKDSSANVVENKTSNDTAKVATTNPSNDTATVATTKSNSSTSTTTETTVNKAALKQQKIAEENERHATAIENINYKYDNDIDYYEDIIEGLMEDTGTTTLYSRSYYQNLMNELDEEYENLSARYTYTSSQVERKSLESQMEENREKWKTAKILLTCCNYQDYLETAEENKADAIANENYTHKQNLAAIEQEYS